MKLARQVIESFEGDLDLASYTDEYQEGLRAIIDAKVAGEEVVAQEEVAPPKVVDLMDALRRSLEQVSGGKKKAAKVAAEGRTTGARKRRVS
jgi:DNA end-binding protein Ku